MMTSGYNIRDLILEAHFRWLKPGEVFFILQNYEENLLAYEPPQKPPSGSLFLFNKRVLKYFRKDGHSWRRKKDGRTAGEAHERLKVGNVEALNCYYAHGEENPNFQRRCYWMLDLAMDHIVLVHYRDITIGKHSAGTISTMSLGSFSALFQSSNSHAIQRTQSAATANGFGEPYDSTSDPSSVEVSPGVVTKSNGTSCMNTTEATEEIGGSPNLEVEQALRRIKEQLSLEKDGLKDVGTVYSENENANHLGFTVHEQNYSGYGGLQYDPSIYVSQQYPGRNHANDYGTPHRRQLLSQDEFTIPSQQPSIWKDYNGSAACDGSSENYVYPSDKNGMLLSQPRSDPMEEQGKYLSGDAAASIDSFMLQTQELEQLKYIPARVYESDSDFCSTLLDQRQIGMHLAADSCLTIAHDQKFTIREISPEWGYATEPTKVLIIGNFTCNPSELEWTCMFGVTEVPVEIIQEGVICCQAPPHLPGIVSLCVTSGNREACSEVREFEYRDKPSSYVHTNSTKKEPSRSSEELLLLVRFVQMLLSNQAKQNGDGTRTDLLVTSMASEDSWAQVFEALLDGRSEPSRITDWLLEELLKDKLQQWLSSKLQDKNALPVLSKGEQGIIHMVSGLGFNWALIPILNSGVGINFRDINGWTALHWATRFGREKMVAELIVSGAFAGAVTDPTHQDPKGKTPASIAATYGHKGLAGYLSEVALTTHLQSLTLRESELSKSSADVEAEETVNSIPTPNLDGDEDRLCLKDTLSAARNAARAASRIQAAFRAHSFKKKKQREAAANASGDEYGFLPSEIKEISAASKLIFGDARHHKAALAIQKKYRGWKGRKDFLSLRRKVVKIQAHVRGYQVRKHYEAICWAVSIVEKIILRWHRKGVGLRGFHLDLESLGGLEDDDDIIRTFWKQQVNVTIGEAVERVLSMVNCNQARHQYRRMLQKYRQAKAEREAWTSQGDDFFS